MTFQLTFNLANFFVVEEKEEGKYPAITREKQEMSSVIIGHVYSRTVNVLSVLSKGYKNGLISGSYNATAHQTQTIQRSIRALPKNSYICPPYQP